MSDEIKVSVRNFYLSSEVSREVPCKKDVLKIKGKDGEKLLLQKHLMTMTLEEAHTMYKNKHLQHKIGLTAFRKLKPENVRKLSETSRRSCLCQTCCNVGLKIEALKTHVKAVTTDENRKLLVCLFVLRFYGPVNPMGSCRARAVYLTTRLLGRLSPLSG